MGRYRMNSLAALFALACLAICPGGAVAQGVVCPAPVPTHLHADGFEYLLSLPGPFATAQRSGTMMRGARATPWLAHAPTDAPGARPLLVFVTGQSIPVASYQSFMRHLASHGFAAAVAAPPNPPLAPDHAEMALEVRALLDALSLPGALPAAVDANRLAAGGHSLGGKIAVMAAGGHARIRALVLLDPVNVHQAGSATQPSIVPEPIGSLAVPLAIFGQTRDQAGTQACTPAAVDYRTVFDAALATARGYEWTVQGAATSDFVSDPDQCGVICTFCQAPTAPSAQTRALVRAASVAFLRTHLATEAPACADLTGKRLPGHVVTRQRVN